MDSPPMPLRFVKSADCKFVSRTLVANDDEAKVTPWMETGFRRTNEFYRVRENKSEV